MKILVHDHSGHPFQAELSRELARRGHRVTHSYVAGYVSGKGRLVANPGETIVFEGIGGDAPIPKDRFVERLRRELMRGFSLVRHVRRVDPDITFVSNVQIPTLVIFAAAMSLLRRPWVLWHQDIYAVALKSLAGNKLSRKFRIVAWLFWVAERWCARRAAAIVVISDSFVAIHDQWGTADKVTVIPNWAPVGEIVPVERDNAWAQEQALDGRLRVLYSGTLGLKHNPALLPELVGRIRDLGVDAQLIVVNEGPAESVLRTESARLGVDLVLLPFQPYERLSEVLSSADLLVAILDHEAGAFSVPSKTLSYLCAGRPVLGLMPEENLAASLIRSAGGCVVSPDLASLDEAALFAAGLVKDAGEAQRIGRQARDLAELEFALPGLTDRFEAILAAASRLPSQNTDRILAS